LNYQTRGFEYLQMVQLLALEPSMVDVMRNLRDSSIICQWIGKNIDFVNSDLKTYLQLCHDCFHPQERRYIQIFAAPLALSLGIYGLCNILTTPITILIDVGRVPPNYWLSLVVHEYAHAHLSNFGHEKEFAKILRHLCLGLGLDSPPNNSTEKDLRSLPYCSSTADPLVFWRGGY
jgi:hypothetical protein